MKLLSNHTPPVIILFDSLTLINKSLLSQNSEQVHNLIYRGKYLKYFFSIALLFAFFQFVSSQEINQKDSLELVNLFKSKTLHWKDAYNSKDANNLVPLYSSDAQYISSHATGLVAAGREKLIANFQNGMNMGGSIDLIEIINMEASCNLATLLCKYQATNSGVTVIGRNLLILKKINNNWLIVLHMTVV
jgi:ketosteroid isomerase-like protein